MSMATAPQAPTSDGAVWHLVEDGFWVGSVSGSFLGTIEQHGARYFARNSTRDYIGEYRSLPAAEDAVAARFAQTTR